MVGIIYNTPPVFGGKITFAFELFFENHFTTNILILEIMKNFDLNAIAGFKSANAASLVNEFEIDGQKIALQDTQEKITTSVWANPSNGLLPGTNFVILGRKSFQAPNSTRPSVALSIMQLNDNDEPVGGEMLLSRKHLNGYNGKQEAGEVFTVSETYMREENDMTNVIGEKEDAKGNKRKVYGKKNSEFARLKVISHA